MQKELEFDILSKIESFSYLTGFCLTVIKNKVFLILKSLE